jgi:FixJ family two-component response regulator
MFSMEPVGESLRIAVVDDDEIVRLALQHLLCASGHEVRLFASAEELLAEDVVADCFLFDVCLPMLSGIDLAARIRATGSDVPIVLMTGHDREPTRSAIAQSGLPLVRKPFDEEEILNAVASGRRGPRPDAGRVT